MQNFMLEFEMNVLLVQQDILKDMQAEEDRIRELEKKRAPRRWWTRQWILRREDLGEYKNIFRELQAEDPDSLKQFIRMDFNVFTEVLERIRPRITKITTNWRPPLSPGLKLLTTLAYLSGGSAYRHDMFHNRMPHNSMCLVVKEVCDAIAEEYESEVIVCPTTQEEWREVAKGFQKKWQFPHCLGAIDGKHVAIKKPDNAGSMYYNHKGWHSIILMACVDSDYKFIWYEVGSNGAASDSQIFRDCDLFDRIRDGTLNMPDDDPLPNDDTPKPYYFISDDALALRTWLMKPHGSRHLSWDQRIFNYRLSRARRIVENAFGILAQRFACLLTTMRQQPQNVATIVRACVCLHNLLRIKKEPLLPRVVDQEDSNHEFQPGFWRRHANMVDMEENVRGTQDERQARKLRSYLTQYVNSPAGSVPWQNRMVRRPADQ